MILFPRSVCGSGSCYFCLFALCFFFNDTATTEIYTLSLHDALPICRRARDTRGPCRPARAFAHRCLDRKSTRLNSSHRCISYAVFCLKKTKKRPDSMKHTFLHGKHGTLAPSRPGLGRVSGPRRASIGTLSVLCSSRCFFFFFFKRPAPPQFPPFPPPRPLSI